MFRAFKLCMLCLVLSWGAVQVAIAGKRVALVIGNSAYAHVTALVNPKNDARDIVTALKRLGFEVIAGIDLDKTAMDQSIRRFAAALEGAEVALFYYAGHGLQVGGQNYLAPVNARLKSEADLDFDMVPLNLVLRQMGRSKRTNLVFLDACRDNPLLKELGRSMGASRSAGLNRGLARVRTVVGTMISYATAPDQVALDGSGRNSPFTQAVLKHIETPGLDIANMMIRVRQDVLKTSNGRQVPWDHSSLTGTFYFKPGSNPPVVSPPPSVKTEPPSGPKVHESTFELEFWNSIRASDDTAMFKSYLERYPKGRFAPIANARITALTKPVPPVVTPVPLPVPVPSARRITLYQSTDLYGGDYRTIKLVPLENCRSQCLSDSRCAAFTYNTRVNWCFLKSQAGNVQSHKDAVSGVIHTGVAPPLKATVYIHENTDFPGNDYNNMRHVSFDACRRACVSDNRCRAFSYIIRDRWCWLKSRLSSPRSKRQVISGIKTGAN